MIRIKSRLSKRRWEGVSLLPIAALKSYIIFENVISAAPRLPLAVLDIEPRSL